MSSFSTLFYRGKPVVTKRPTRVGIMVMRKDGKTLDRRFKANRVWLQYWGRQFADWILGGKHG